MDIWKAFFDFNLPKLDWVHETKAVISLTWVRIRNVYLTFQGNGLITADLIYVARLFESNRRYSNVTTVTVDICTEVNVITLE